jgi:replicative DNA helicase
MTDNTNLLNQMPPAAPEVEASILGAMLIDSRCIGDIAAVLGTDGHRMYDVRHARIYDAVLAVYGDNRPVDQITVCAELQGRGELDLVGGVIYMAELASGVASAGNSAAHADIVARAAHNRSLIEIYSEGLQRAYKAGADPAVVQESVDAATFDLATTGHSSALVGMDVTMLETAGDIDAAHAHDGLIGVTSGLRDLDGLTSGLHKSDLIILAARPSQGKTALALTHTLAAATSGVGVAFFSLEMSKSQIGQRLVATRAHLDLHKMRSGKLTTEEHAAAAVQYNELSKLPIWIDDSAGTTPMEMRAKLRRITQKADLGLIVVDYLQLMHGTERAHSREQEVSGFSRALKGLAKEFNVPVLALSQLNRAAEQRSDHRPVLSDLRDSGSIEQDADVVMFLYRAEMYGIENDADGHSTEGIADIILGKQRQGPPGTVAVQFNKATVEFRNLAPRWARI